MTHVHVLINTFKTDSRKYSMTPTNYTSTSAQANEIFPIELKRLWLMRILVKLNGLRRLFDDPSYYLLSFIGIEKINLSKAEMVKLGKQLNDAHLAAERNATVTVGGDLANNIHSLANLIGLNLIEQSILGFVILANNDRVLSDCAETINTPNFMSITRALAEILNIEEVLIKEALHPNAPLAKMGIVKVDVETPYLRGKFRFSIEDLPVLMLQKDMPILQILKGALSLAEPSKLGLDDFSYVQKDVAIVLPYLRQALHQQSQGVNVLFYGPPGTGKTQLAKTIAHELAASLYEVAVEINTSAKSGPSRLQAYQLGQSILAKHSALILFDEVQDIFDDGDATKAGHASTAQTRKALINQLLEKNPLPAIWVSNSISCFDDAFIRRFDHIIEVGFPSEQQRQTILNTHCQALQLSPNVIQHMAQTKALSPAIIERAAKVTRLICQQQNNTDTEAVFTHLVHNTLRAQGHTPNKLNTHALSFDPNWINADAPITQLMEYVLADGNIRLCLSGPPGTGKTEFGKWLATQANRPLHVRRASDILSKYVGGTEENLALVFRQAERENAVLLLDEADTYLNDRNDLKHSWEVSSVNEMLVQMEAFNGVLIATTNRLEVIDNAAMRRFDFKVRFYYLKPNQIIAMLQNLVSALGLTPNAAAWLNINHQLKALSHITPSDFSLLQRQIIMLRKTPSLDDLYSGLLAASQGKQSKLNKPFGFVH